MAAYVFAGGQYHLMAGQHVIKGGQAIPLKSSDQIVLQHVGYPLGCVQETIPQPVPPSTDIPDVAHVNGQEPTGSIWYITPDGSGTKDGRSWANARGISQIHVTMLDAADGDILYFAEGSYTTDRPIQLRDDMQVYGGFDATAPSWETRDGFGHQTLFAGNGQHVLCTGARMRLDGIAVRGYAGLTDDSGIDGRISNSSLQVTCKLAAYDHCLFSGGGIAPVDESKRGTAADCNLYGSTVTLGVMQRCNFVGCTTDINADGVKGTIDKDGNLGPDENGELYVTEDCLFVGGDTKIHSARRIKAVGEAGNPARFQGGVLTDSEAWHCTSDTAIYSYALARCVAHHCTAPVIYSTVLDHLFASLAGTSLHDCQAYDCTATDCIYDTHGVAYNEQFFDPEPNWKNHRGLDISRCHCCNCTAPRLYYAASVSRPNLSQGCNGGNVSHCNVYNCSCDDVYVTHGGNSRAKNVPGNGGNVSHCNVYNTTCAWAIYNIQGGIAESSSAPDPVSGIADCCKIVNTHAKRLCYDWHNGGDTSDNLHNGLVVSCQIDEAANARARHTTIVNTRAATLYEYAWSSLSWGNTGLEFAAYSAAACQAGSDYNAKLTLTLGRDNTIAQFADTGFGLAGVQDVGPCPCEETDPSACATWLEQFGDWHPRPESYLVGKAQTYAKPADNAGYQRDLDGKIRPHEPGVPTIGCYEVNPLPEPPPEPAAPAATPQEPAA